MKTFLHSDWLRALQFYRKTEKQCKKRNTVSARTKEAGAFMSFN